MQIGLDTPFTKRYFIPAAVAIVLLSGLVYLPSIHGSKIWDDNELLSGKGLGSAVSIPQCFTSPFLYHYYRPLTSASFILDHRLWDHGVWGSNTFGYHLTNVLLHVCTTALMLPVLLLAFRSRPIAILGALLFAIQPAQVSAVAWIGGRTDSLCTLFISLFFLTLISGARSAGAKRKRLVAASICCYGFAVLAKEQALFLLPLAPFALLAFSEKTANRKESRSEMALMTALLVPVSLCLLWAWSRFGAPLHPKWRIMHQLPLIGPTVDYYTMLLFTPTPALGHIMTLYTMERLGRVGVLVGFTLAILAIVCLIRLCRNEPAAAWFFAGALLLLAPVSNLYPMTTQTIAPYRAGTAGLCAAAVAGWAIVRMLAWNSAAPRGKLQTALIAVPVIVYVSWLFLLTCSDNAVWKNSLTASAAVEKYDPHSVFGKLETANAYLEFGKFEPAVARLDDVSRTIQALPTGGAQSDSALAWSNKNSLAEWAAGLYGRAGLLKLDSGDRQAAISVLSKGKALSPKNEQVNAGLANYALAAHDFASAELPIRCVLEHEPSFTGLRLRLGRFLMEQKRWSEADAEFTICHAQAPTDIEICLLTALARVRSGNRIAAAQVLNDGLTRHTLEQKKLQEWLGSIGEPRLLK